MRVSNRHEHGLRSCDSRAEQAAEPGRGTRQKAAESREEASADQQGKGPAGSRARGEPGFNKPGASAERGAKHRLPSTAQ